MAITQKKAGLTGNMLKLIALVAMTLDHIGLSLLPQHGWLRVVGRLALPIFAYMIAEGCHHTRSMGRYLLTMAAVAAVCQGVYWVAMGSLYQCILVTFSLSVAVIWALRGVQTRPTVPRVLALTGVLGAVIFVTLALPRLLPGTDFAVDYGFCGVLLPVLVWLGRTRSEKLGLCALGLAALVAALGTTQLPALLAIPLLALYNGQRGRLRLKYLFYIYYPAHLAAIYLIGLLLGGNK